jgi:hypothetical protein
VRRALVVVAVLVFAGSAGGACQKGAPPLDDDPAVARVKDAGAAVKKGPIGDSGEAPSSYVLVDVENISPKDRLVTLQGKLTADGQAPVALGADELRIPAHDVRTFALVADAVAPEAARPTHAVAVDYAPPIELGSRDDRRGDLFVATARAKNTVERAASVVFACTFYDAAGKILARPFTVVDLPPNGEQVLRFEGPRESERAVLFVGQVAFKP